MDLRKTFNRIGKFFLGNSMDITSWGFGNAGGWSKGDLLRQYKTVVYAVISAIAEDAAKVEFEVNNKNGKPVKSHPILDLFKHPNPDMSQFQFLELHFTFMKTMGEAFWYLGKGAKSGKIKELYFLNPAKMEVVVNKDARGTVGGYVLSKQGGDKETFEPEEVAHFKMPNPSNPYRGLGTIEAGKTYIQTEEFASEWTNRSLYNSGRPSGIVNVEGTIDEEAFRQLKAQFKQDYSGTKNAGRTFFTRGADKVSFQKLGMELNELALKDLKDMTRDDIMMMFRVSKTMLGISDDVNRANGQENHAVFTQNVIKPELDRFVDHINAFVMPLMDKSGAMLGYEDPDLQSDEDKLAEWTVGINKWLTIDEIREQRNLDPLPNKLGEVLYVPINLVPLTPETAKPKEPIVNPPKNDPNAKPPKEPAPAKNIKKKGINPFDVYIQLLWDNQTQWEKKYKSFMQNEFVTQQTEILKRNKKAYDEWLFDVDASKTRIVGGLSPMAIELIREAGIFALDLANDNDTEFEINQRIKLFVHERIGLLADSTNDTSIKAIEQTIADGVLAGETVTDLRNRIMDVYDYADSIRAEMIARTETIAASNQGALEAYRQSPIVVKKEWITNPDACPICEPFDGKIIGIDEYFARIGDTLITADGKEFSVTYNDIEAGNLHPNCRCTIKPVVVNN